MQSVIRVGEVSKVNYDKGTIEVAYKDRDDSVTDEICMVSNNLYRMPVVGQMACVLHNSADQEMGTCIGTFWNDDNKPPGGKEGLYRYDYNDKQGVAYESYDGKSGNYEEKIDGNTTETVGKNATHKIGGDLKFIVGGSTVTLTQGGTIKIAGTDVEIKGSTVNISGGSWPVYRGWRYREAAVIGRWFYGMGRNWQLCRAGIHSVELARRNAGQYQRLHVEQLGRP